MCCGRVEVESDSINSSIQLERRTPLTDADVLEVGGQQHYSIVLLFSFQHCFNMLRAEVGKQHMHMLHMQHAQQQLKSPTFSIT
jgi:hypothetical protein